jgi:hypothetical protein
MLLISRKNNTQHALINNCRMAVISSVVARIKFGITGQGSIQQSATIHSAKRYRALSTILNWR